MSDRSSTSGGGTGVPDIDSLSGAYALNALSDDERDQFETRLSESHDLQKEVTQLNETALLLGHAVRPVAPSPALKASIMGLLDSTPQLPALPVDSAYYASTSAASPIAGSAGGRHASSAEAASESAGGELLAPIPLARQRWFMRPGVLLAGVAAAAVLVFGGVGISNSFTHPAGPAISQQADGEMSQILAASDVQHTVSDISTGGKATLYWSSDLQRSAVILDGTTSLPSGKTYQLWYINGSSIKSAGTVSATSNTVTQVLQGDLVKGDTVGITVEPAGGSKQPTTKPIVAIQV